MTSFFSRLRSGTTTPSTSAGGTPRVGDDNDVMDASCPRAALIGRVGAGKTTLFNRVCDAHRQAEITDDSCTRSFAKRRVFYDGCAMELLDGPGCSSTEDVYAHSYVLKEGLTAEPLHGIFVAVSYDARIRNNMGGHFYEAAKMLKPEYHDLIVLVVTKMDQFEPDQNKFTTRDAMETHIAKIFREDYGVTRVLFSDRDMSGADLFHAMRDALSFHGGSSASSAESGKLPLPVQLSYSDEEFFEYFDVKAWKGREQFDFHRLKKKVETLTAGYEEGLQHLMENRQKYQQMEFQDLLYALIQQSRVQLEEDIYDGFCKRHGEDQVAFDDYATSIELQKIIHKAHREFRDQVKRYLAVNPDNVCDWRNAVRRCQYCGEVWVKVEGCDGETTCGARPTTNEKRADPSFFRLVWNWVEGRLRPGSFLMRNRNLEHPLAGHLTLGEDRSVRKIGCGKSIVWKNQAIVPAAELDQLFSTQELENILSSFKMESRFVALKKKKERKIQVFSKLDKDGCDVLEAAVPMDQSLFETG
ncbi:unnamed protein product [Amoebophrya sp. A25]|nr:unnamed protein product [Amoebophrya sp. A25]|eukprot:GSA25T00009154001.1